MPNIIYNPKFRNKIPLDSRTHGNPRKWQSRQRRKSKFIRPSSKQHRLSSFRFSKHNSQKVQNLFTNLMEWKSALSFACNKTNHRLLGYSKSKHKDKRNYSSTSQTRTHKYNTPLPHLTNTTTHMHTLSHKIHNTAHAHRLPTLRNSTPTTDTSCSR